MSKQDKKDRQWQEVEEYRSLLEAPGTYEEGFTIRTLLGVLFISIIMSPGEMYLGLVTGAGVGAAAQWVTVILFLEVARRSFATLRRQEIYLLVYVASALIAREEGMFLGLIQRQYLVGSEPFRQFGLSKILPWWWAPKPDSEAILNRTFLHKDWLVPILLLIIGTIVGRITWFTSGYTLFRLTSDYERLPFPTAPMSALTSMALAEETGSERETWKWPVFSIGGAIGAAFGAIYVGVPAVSGVLFNKTIMLIPIPWVDFTPYTGNVLAATPIALTLSLGPIIGATMAPFWAIIGSSLGIVTRIVASPILHHYGFFPRWQLGMDLIQTEIATGIDFWRPFSIGITLAVTVISFYQVVTAGRRERAKREKGFERRGWPPPPEGRGDFPIWICIGLFALGALYPILLAKTLFPMLLGTGLIVTFLLIGLVYAPLMSVVSARLDGLIGFNVGIPYIHESVIFLTGYRGVEIWFIPFPGTGYGGNAEQFRIVELTGMKFTSLLKAELFMIPIVFFFSLMYWSFLWKLAPIPSESYPYAQKMWPLSAFNQALYLSSTMYSRMWKPGDEIEGEPVPEQQVVWSPSNLQDRTWWYWRARVTDEVWVPNPGTRVYGTWSQAGVFYTDFSAHFKLTEPRWAELKEHHVGEDVIARLQELVNQEYKTEREFTGALVNTIGKDETLRYKPLMLKYAVFSDRGSPDTPPAPIPPPEEEEPPERPGGRPLPAPPALVSPLDSTVVSTPNPMLTILTPGHGRTDSLDYYFEIDQLPTFDGEFLQRSTDRPLLFRTLLNDASMARDRKDNDGDGRVDEEWINQKDDDGDGRVDEDTRHPLGGKKWPIILIGMGFGLFFFLVLSLFNLPIFLIWGYVRSTTGLPTAMMLEIFGALLARLYFWKRYGKQQWRRHAMVLTAGFGVGMSLIGLLSSGLAMIAKAVSALTY